MFLLPTAALVSILLGSIYFIVQKKVFGDLHDILRYEAIKHTKEIKVNGDQLYFATKNEMLEREHREADANPVFIQLVDYQGNLMDKSPNLKEALLNFDPNHTGSIDKAFTLNNKRIRQTQVAISIDSKTVGYVITAVSSENAEQLVESLRKYLLVTFPLVLLILFFSTRFLAGRSILPVSRIIKAANTISSTSLNQRIEVPEQKDELHDLTISINNLLERVHKGMDREKQFTSDAAHELRTPLAVLKGTLEVLIRKPRPEAEYKEKIAECIIEIDRLTTLSEQLLHLARMEYDGAKHKETVDLIAFTQQLISRFKEELSLKQIDLKFIHPDNLMINSNSKLLELIFENLLSNAIKYSNYNGIIRLVLSETIEGISLTFTDNGIGISKEKLQKIFDPFFRVSSIQNKEIKGTGLGLSIVRKSCEVLEAKIKIESNPGEGTEVKVSFPKSQ